MDLRRAKEAGGDRAGAILLGPELSRTAARELDLAGGRGAGVAWLMREAGVDGADACKVGPTAQPAADGCVQRSPQRGARPAGTRYVGAAADGGRLRRDGEAERR